MRWREALLALSLFVFWLAASRWAPSRQDDEESE